MRTSLGTIDEESDKLVAQKEAFIWTLGCNFDCFCIASGFFWFGVLICIYPGPVPNYIPKVASGIMNIKRYHDSRFTRSTASMIPRLT